MALAWVALALCALSALGGGSVPPLPTPSPESEVAREYLLAAGRGDTGGVRSRTCAPALPAFDEQQQRDPLRADPSFEVGPVIEVVRGRTAPGVRYAQVRLLVVIQGRNAPVTLFVARTPAGSAVCEESFVREATTEAALAPPSP